MPKTKLGKWSVGLIIAMPVLFLIGVFFNNLLYQSVSAGNTILDDVAKRPALSLAMLAGMLSGILAFGIGLVAIIRPSERSPLVYISTIIGALLLLFLLGEIFSPH